MPNLEYMAAAYGIIWAAILIYFLGLARKQRVISAELKDLRESLNGSAKDETDAS